MTDQTSQSQYTCNGQELRVLASAGLHWLESHYQHVNELNVFPVPDGDTGTNMMMTMQNAYKEVAEDTTAHVGKLTSKLAHGAMMGSRGNSGTILSQLWLGFARVIEEHETFDASLAVKALREATETAYRGVQRPVEGTILSVAREMTEEAEALIDTTQDLISILEAMVTRGWAAVERTPEFLPVLKKAGVVDAGGTGLVYILEGMLRYLRGEEVQVDEPPSPEERLEAMHDGPQLEHPGENIYDVQFVIKGESLSAETVKAAMERMGDSVVVVGSNDAIKVHVHVRNPGIPLEYGANVGPLSDVVVENMLEQYLVYRQQRLGTEDTPTDETLDFRSVEAGQVAVVAVAAGQGIAKVFQELGVAGIVRGGQTNNPSTEEILHAIEPLATNKVILLPNNKNIILSAEQAVRLAEDRDVRVVPTRTFPQGISAMFAYRPDGELDEIMAAMMDAYQIVITAEVTRATRTAEIDGVSVEHGQVIGLLDGQLKVAGEDYEPVIRQLLDMIDLDDMELVTLYYGDEVAEDDAQSLTDALVDTYDHLEFETIFGGQKHYPYILSVE